MSNGAGLFQLLQKLSEAEVLGPEQVGNLVRAELSRDTAASDEVSDVFAGNPDDGTIASVSLARPASPLSGTASALRLSLAPSAQITKEDVREAYGLESSTIVPTPREPPGSPMALWYRRDWADIMFTFPLTENRLTSVSIDERSPEDE